MNHPSIRAAAAGIVAAAALAAPSVASAATLVTSTPCQYPTAEMAVAGNGFTPGSQVSVVGGPIFFTVTAGPDGSFTATFPAPPVTGSSLTAPTSYSITATDTAGVSATASFRTVNLAFRTSTGQSSPKKVRTWYFSGFVPGRPIYGHFRYKGKTKGNYRFGVAKAPCGTLTVRAPGFPIKGRVNSGQWTVAIDQAKAYSPKTKNQIVTKTVVYTVYTRRTGGA